MDRYLEAALKLHQCIVKEHWDGKTIVGPDPIGRINWRVTRFIRSYLSWIPWSDQYVFLQGQGYWLQDNLKLAELTGEDAYLDIARASADYICRIQRDDGCWAYPQLRERRHFIGTVEGIWASTGLLAAYRKFGESRYLEAVGKWYDFQINMIGFQEYRDSLAINYYYRSTTMVPNNTTLLLRLLAEIYAVTGDRSFLEHTEPMIRFLQYCQSDSGDFPYSFQRRDHLLCYQYNSYEFLDLAHYYDVMHDDRVIEIMGKLIRYLATGLTSRGSCRYNCFQDDPEVNYHTAALAAALRKAAQLGLGQFEAASEKAYQRLLSQQSADGGFYFSRRNYVFLKDTRSYPRSLAMILSLLLRAGR